MAVTNTTDAEGTHIAASCESALCDDVLAVLPVGRDLLGLFVVTSEAMNAALDKDKAELGVLVLTVPVKVLADIDCLLDEHVQVFRDIRCQPISLEDTKNLVSSNCAHLGDTLGIT